MNKSRKRILTVCEHGNVRSVALAYLIKTIYNHDVIACGMKSNSKETLLMLVNWADKVIILDKDLAVEFMTMPGISGNKGERTFFLADVGEDIWHNPKAEELNHKLLKQLKNLDL